MWIIEYSVSNPSIALLALLLMIVASVYAGRLWEARFIERLVDRPPHPIEIELVTVARDVFTQPDGIPATNAVTELYDENLLLRERVALLEERLARVEHTKETHWRSLKAERERVDVLFAEIIQNEVELPVEDYGHIKIEVPTPGANPPRRVPLVPPRITRQFEDVFA